MTAADGMAAYGAPREAPLGLVRYDSDVPTEPLTMRRPEAQTRESSQFAAKRGRNHPALFGFLERGEMAL